MNEVKNTANGFDGIKGINANDGISKTDGTKTAPKTNGTKDNKRKESDLQGFFKKNKFAVVGGIIILILAVVMLIVYSNKNSDNDTSSTSNVTTQNQQQTTSQQVDVLPQKERIDDTNASGSTNNSAAADPFSQPPVLTGLILNNEGQGIALIKANGKSYVAEKGDIIAEVWVVDTVNKDEVILKSDKGDITLQMSGK
jgi:hypothetical protein